MDGFKILSYTVVFFSNFDIYHIFGSIGPAHHWFWAGFQTKPELRVSQLVQSPSWELNRCLWT